MLTTLTFITDILHHFQKFFKILRLLFQNVINVRTDKIAIGIPLFKLRILTSFRISLHINDRKAMLDTDNITKPLQSNSRKIKIPELLSTVQGSGVKYDVVVNMSFVCVSCNDESMLSLCKSHCSFRSPHDWLLQL